MQNALDPLKIICISLMTGADICVMMPQQIWKFYTLTSNFYMKRSFAYEPNLHSAWSHFILKSLLFV